MKKYYMVLWFIIPGLCLKAQTISAGFGLFDTNQKDFRNGKQYQFEVGIRFTKRLQCSFQYSKGTTPDVVNFYPMQRLYSDGRFTDTFYNVTETNKFSLKTFLLKTRFYCNPKHKLNLFVSPIIGFSQLTETKIYKSQYYNTTEKYPGNYFFPFSGGLEIGLEFPLTKHKNILLNVSNTILYINSKYIVTDVYNPSFNSQNTRYISFQANLRYEFSSKFTNLKTKKGN